MTAGELIKELSKYPADEPVCINNHEVWCVEPKPAYWDGTLQRLIVDESKKPYYSVIGVRYTNRGGKLELSSLDLGDVLLNDPDAIVEYDVTPSKKEFLEKFVARERAEINQIIKEVEQESK